MNTKRIFIFSLAFVLCASLLTFTVAPTTANAKREVIEVPSATNPDFGPNVFTFKDTMDDAKIQEQLNKISKKMVPNHFGSERYAVMFEPGSYNVNAELGYYTSLYGLGLLPKDVDITGGVTVWAQDRDNDELRMALNNFWRSAENVTIHPTDNGINWWAVSQASPLRRVDITGKLGLFDWKGGFASGGYLADSRISGDVINAPQQQWYTRETTIGGWTNGVWNQVFSGVEGAPATSFPTPNPYTTLETTKVSKEKPFIYVAKNGTYNVFVPEARKNARGTTWADGKVEGRSISIKDFYIAKPEDSARKINKALSKGKHIIFTPGIYYLTETLNVKHKNTILLGLGMATLEPVGGVAALDISASEGVDVAGLLIEAGTVNSKYLVRVGKGCKRSNPNNPNALQDVFFRIGGAHVGKATTSLIVDSDYTILDNLWVWRADHGDGVGWTKNTADTGVVVNGDHVTATGLFVEHYQKYQTIWNGEDGTTIMYQSEIPYDVPSQAAWMNGRTKGYASYKVADHVRKHTAYGLGMYCFFNDNPSVHLASGIETPVGPGIKFTSLVTVSLNNKGSIDNVVNNFGGPTVSTTTAPTNVVAYPVNK